MHKPLLRQCTQTRLSQGPLNLGAALTSLLLKPLTAAPGSRAHVRRPSGTAPNSVDSLCQTDSSIKPDLKCEEIFRWNSTGGNIQVFCQVHFRPALGLLMPSRWLHSVHVHHNMQQELTPRMYWLCVLVDKKILHQYYLTPNTRIYYHWRWAVVLPASLQRTSWISWRVRWRSDGK